MIWELGKAFAEESIFQPRTGITQAKGERRASQKREQKMRRP